MNAIAVADVFDRLQYQDCRGEWNDCPNDEEMIARLMTNNGPPQPTKPNGWSDEGWSRLSANILVPRHYATRDATREEVSAALDSGIELRNHREDWYSKCRQKPAPRPPQKPAEMVTCSCGHTVPKILVMSASLGTSCPDCYDRLSN